MKKGIEQEARDARKKLRSPWDQPEKTIQALVIGTSKYYDAKLNSMEVEPVLLGYLASVENAVSLAKSDAIALDIPVAVWIWQSASWQLYQIYTDIGMYWCGFDYVIPGINHATEIKENHMVPDAKSYGFTKIKE